MNYVNFTRFSRYLNISLNINRRVTTLCKGKGRILVHGSLPYSFSRDDGPRPQDLFT